VKTQALGGDERRGNLDRKVGNKPGGADIRVGYGEHSQMKKIRSKKVVKGAGRETFDVVRIPNTMQEEGWDLWISHPEVGDP